jgi:hypothetical protein
LGEEEEDYHDHQGVTYSVNQKGGKKEDMSKNVLNSNKTIKKLFSKITDPAYLLMDGI